MKKRNGLVLASGIIFVVASLVCCGLAVLFALNLTAINSEAFVELKADLGELILGLYQLMLVAMTVVYFIEFIVFLTMGIKLIVKGARKLPFSSYKSFVIIVQIFGYVGAGLTLTIDMGYDFIAFALLLVGSILLSVALAKNKNVENAMAGLGGNQDVFQNGFDGMSSTEEQSHEAEVRLSQVQDLTAKLKLLSDLKNNGTISNEVYIDLVHKLLGLDTDKDKSPKEK